MLDAVHTHLAGHEAPAAPAKRLAETPIDGPPVDGRVLRDLEKLGGQSFVDEIIAQFVADASRLLPELSEAAAAQDMPLFRDHLHALRSGAGNVGAVGLYKLCLASQSMTTRELIGEGSGYVERLQTEFERAVIALDEHAWRDAA